MFLRPCFRFKDGKPHAYRALVESYRTARGSRQRVVAYLGALDEERDAARSQVVPDSQAKQQDWLQPESKRLWVQVDAARVEVLRARAFGGLWLGWQLVQRLELQEWLRHQLPRGREEVAWSVMTWVLVLARLCDPSSELYIAEHLYAQTALGDLLGVPENKINEDRLYRALDALLPHKSALEKHLKERLGELFAMSYDLLLYDVTSTYFEGQAAANAQAQEAIHGIGAGTASRCASPWWWHGAASRWATNCSTATAPTSPRCARSWRGWRPATGKRIGCG